MVRLLHLILVSALFHCSLKAETTAPSFLLFQLDNDLFSDIDREYTSGVRLALLRPVPEQQLSRLQRWMQPFTGDQQADVTTYTWGTGLSQLMFTPEDHEALTPPPGQRPYAGWLGLELSLHAQNPTEAEFFLSHHRNDRQVFFCAQSPELCS